jgi:hypothetical protein
MTSLQRKIWLERAGISVIIPTLKESFGDDHDFKNLKPIHSFNTDDNHKIDVHLFNGPNGQHAVFFNKNLNAVTKLVHWNHGASRPTNSELEKAGSEDQEHNLKEEEEKITADSAGKIAEHSLVIHLMNHMHKQKGTYGSSSHKSDITAHEKEIERLGSGVNANDIELRKEHGRAAAAAAIETIKMEHGPKATIERVGHTAKSGDIGKFTHGKHNDDQTNPSDVAVHIKNSSKSTPEDPDHYHGFSLKSSSKSSQITAKNPAIHMHGLLDHPSRKFGAETISRSGLKGLHAAMGVSGKSAAERGRMIAAAREQMKPKPTKLIKPAKGVK